MSKKNPYIIYVGTNTEYFKLISDWYPGRLYRAKFRNKALEFIRSVNAVLIIIEEDMTDLAVTLGNEFPNAGQILVGTGQRPDFLIQALNSGHSRRYVNISETPVKWRKIITEAIEAHVAVRIRKQTLTDLRYMVRKLNFLHEISEKISETKPLHQLLEDIMESSRIVMDAEASSLLLYDSETEKLHFDVARGNKGGQVRNFSVELGSGIAGWVALHRKSQLIRDCYADSRFNPEMDRRTAFTTKSMICVPLIRKDQLLGVMQVINKADGGIFEERDLSIFETLASQCAIAIENARLVAVQVETEAIERELKTAREIQQSLLPGNLPRFEDMECAATLIPAKEVGGDFYTIMPIDDVRSLFFIADVVGKSISAALIVSTLYSCLNTFLNTTPGVFDLRRLVKAMNRVLLESITADKFVTAWFGLYNHATHVMQSINAGHNLPLIFRRRMSEPLRLKDGGFALGIFDAPYASEEIRMEAGDFLIFYTDGVTEAWNEETGEYGSQRLNRLISENTDKNAPDMLAEILQDIKRHAGETPQSDDITCAVIRVTSGAGRERIADGSSFSMADTQDRNRAFPKDLFGS